MRILEDATSRSTGRFRIVRELTGPRVLLAGTLTAATDGDGAGRRLAALAQALEDQGANAQVWRPWEDALAPGDILHLVDASREHLPLVDEARRRGVKVVLSTHDWCDLSSTWAAATDWMNGGWQCGELLLRGAFPRLPGWRRRLYQRADLILPSSQAEADQLMRFYGVPASSLRVIPQAADPRFADPRDALPAEIRALGRFILCPGTIQRSHNQLGLIRALRGCAVPLVFVGDVAPGHEAYARLCRREATSGVRFLGPLDRDAPAWEGCLRGSACLVQVGWRDASLSAALEAAMSGVPLVLPRPGAAHEYFGPLARYVNPSQTSEIRRQALESFAGGRQTELARLVRGRFTWSFVAERIRELYDSLN